MMLKKIFTLILGIVVTFTFAQAQEFTFVMPNPLHDTTSGSAVFQQGDANHTYFELTNWIKNISTQSYKITWQFLNVDSAFTQAYADSAVNLPFVAGICDNINCRGEFLPWFYGAPQQSDAIAPNATCSIYMNVYCPSSLPDTTMTFKVKLTATHQIDTAIFILTKASNTGISTTNVTDKTVFIYPNPLPTGRQLHIYVNKSLNVRSATIYNIIGQQEKVFSLQENKEIQNLNVNQLPAGMYLIKITNDRGAVIATRKFSKQ